jgi:hypothetical protein
MRLATRTGVLLAACTVALFDSHPAAAVDPLDPLSSCSVFDAAPCTPFFCGVFGPWPCVPLLPSFGEGLRLAVESRAAKSGRAPTGPINSLRELFAALRGCWEPPPQEVSGGMQMSVRFSFKRNGEIIAPPHVTYTSSNADPEVKRIYGEAIDAALARCTPMPFSKQMGGAVAGRPISIRFIDNRKRSKD